VVAVNGDIVALWVNDAILGGVWNAVITVLLFKIMLQVKIGAVRRLHDGVIYGRIVNDNPADHVWVLLKERPVLVVYRPFGRWGFAGLLRRGRLLNLRGYMPILFLSFSFSREIPPKLKAGEQQNGS